MHTEITGGFVGQDDTYAGDAITDGRVPDRVSEVGDGHEQFDSLRPRSLY